VRQYIRGDPIRVQATGDGRPVAFSWHGQLHRVATIEDVREPRLEWWSPSGEVHRRYHLVTTHQGLICEIYHDMTGGGWYMGRVYDERWVVGGGLGEWLGLGYRLSAISYQSRAAVSKGGPVGWTQKMGRGRAMDPDPPS